MESNHTFESVTAALREIGKCCHGPRINRNEKAGGGLTKPWLSASFAASSAGEADNIAEQVWGLPLDHLGVHVSRKRLGNCLLFKVDVDWQPGHIDHPVGDCYIVPCIKFCDSMSRGAS